MEVTMLDCIKRTPRCMGDIIENAMGNTQGVVNYLGEDVKRINEIVVIGSGSSYNAAITANSFMEKVSGLPVRILNRSMILSCWFTNRQGKRLRSSKKRSTVMKDNDRETIVIVSSVGVIFVIWLGLLMAPYADSGLASIITGFINAMNDPFRIQLCRNSLKTVLVLLLAYGLGIGVWLSTRKNYRRNEEHGSAKWGRASDINRKYSQPPYANNRILTQNVSIGLNVMEHQRNLNTIVIGGSGSGKTRFYCKPNVMQANTSFVVLDPKGEILRDTGNLLKEKGYDIKILDLINMDKSHCYNPFVYLHDDNDVQKLVTNLFKATTPKGAVSQDPFWDTAAQMLLLALIFYLKYEAPENEQNFEMVMEMLRSGSVDESDNNVQSPLDMLFSDLEMRHPEHIALKYYRDYHSGAAKTLKSIQITLASRLEKFNLESVASLTRTDELELETIGERKTALFALIPDNDTSFNFLVSVLYTQLFQQLFYMANNKYDGKVPVSVHFVMDEFANVSLPDDFDKILSVMRSRNVTVSIILQNLAQLKTLFEKQWESIVGNCDELLYLGGNEQSTHKYVSELMGKETIDTNTYGKSTGHSGSYTTNYQNTGRDLMTPDEVRMMDNRYAMLFIRSERPIRDLKYDIMRHPDIDLSADGKGKPFVHGSVDQNVASIKVDYLDNGVYETPTSEGIEIEVLTNEELERSYENDEKENT